MRSRTPQPAVRMPTFAVILPAAGRSVRFGGGRDKLLEPLAGRPLIARTVAALLAHEAVGLLVIATHQRDRLESALLGSAGNGTLDPRITFSPGGPSRAESVLAALRQVPDTFEWVAVHDAARPLVSRELITRTLAVARERDA